MIPDARVDVRIGHVREQVEQHEEARAHEHAAQYHRVVSFHYTIKRVPSEPVPAKNRLGEHRAVQIAPEVYRDERYDGYQGVPKRVLGDHFEGREALRLCGQYELRGQRLDEAHPGDTSYVRGGVEAERGRGQDQVRQTPP